MLVAATVVFEVPCPGLDDAFCRSGRPRNDIIDAMYWDEVMKSFFLVSICPDSHCCGFLANPQVGASVGSVSCCAREQRLFHAKTLLAGIFYAS